MRTFLAATILLLNVGRCSAQLRPFGDAHAIVGARIEIGDGRVIEKGDVLIREGRIVAVGVGLKIPPDAEILKADGLIVFPGFIDGFLNKGLKLPDAQPNQDAPPERAAEASPSMREANRKGIRADLHAAEWLNFTEADVTAIRKSGFTTALVGPTGGLINGTAVLVNLSGRPRRETVVRSDAALCLALKMGGGGPFSFGGGYPGTILGYLADLRQTMLDAGYQSGLQAAYERGGSRRPPYDAVLMGLRIALDSNLPSLIEADSETEVNRALDFAEEFHLKPIICGGAEAFKHADRLARSAVPVIVSLKLPMEPKAKPETKPTEKPAEPVKPGDAKPEAKPEKPAEGKPDSQKPADAATKSGDKPAEPDDPDADAPMAARTEKRRLWEETLANARKLYQAGVLIAFTTRGNKTPTEFWENLRKAVKDGLPREAALKGLTVSPARILGMEKHVGAVEAGKTANLVLMSADFLDPKTETRYIFVDGWKFDTKLEKPGPPPPGSEFPFRVGGAGR